MPISASISRASSSSSSSTSSDSNFASRKIASDGATRSRILLLEGLVGELVGVAVEDVDVRLGGQQRRARGSAARSTVGRDDRRTGLEVRLSGLRGGLEVRRRAPSSAAASFSSRGIAFSTVCRSARISSVWIVEMSLAGVDLAVDVGDVLVAEHPGHLADRGGLADVGEELVAQPLALGRAADDAGDVDELARSRAAPWPTRRARPACASRASGTPTTPTFGSMVANG